MSAQLETGRALDALVAEKVMGWTDFDWSSGYYAVATCPTTNIRQGVPHFSTEIAAAWLVVEAMKAEGWDVALRWVWDGYGAEFDNMARTHSASVDPREGGMPLAICRAALAVRCAT